MEGSPTRGQGRTPRISVPGGRFLSSAPWLGNKTESQADISGVRNIPELWSHCSGPGAQADHILTSGRLLEVNVVFFLAKPLALKRFFFLRFPMFSLLIPKVFISGPNSRLPALGKPHCLNLDPRIPKQESKPHTRVSHTHTTHACHTLAHYTGTPTHTHIPSACPDTCTPTSVSPPKKPLAPGASTCRPTRLCTPNRLPPPHPTTLPAPSEKEGPPAAQRAWFPCALPPRGAPPHSLKGTG